MSARESGMNFSQLVEMMPESALSRFGERECGHFLDEVEKRVESNPDAQEGIVTALSAFTALTSSGNGQAEGNIGVLDLSLRMARDAYSRSILEALKELLPEHKTCDILIVTLLLARRKKAAQKLAEARAEELLKLSVEASVASFRCSIGRESDDHDSPFPEGVSPEALRQKQVAHAQAMKEATTAKIIAIVAAKAVNLLVNPRKN